MAKLSYRTTTPELEDAFSKYGKVPFCDDKCLQKSCNTKVSENLQIASCKVSRLPGPERQSRGFAFVEFENGDDASAAIKGLDKSMLGDRCDPHLTTFISSNVTTFFSDMAITTGRLLCRERVVTKDIARPRVILGVYFNSQARIPSTFLFCR